METNLTTIINPLNSNTELGFVSPGSLSDALNTNSGFGTASSPASETGLLSLLSVQSLRDIEGAFNTGDTQPSGEVAVSANQPDQLLGVAANAMPLVGDLTETTTASITAEARGSRTPQTVAAPNSVVNGDFLINGTNSTAPVGDGVDERTTWSFDFTQDPDLAAFLNAESLSSATLTLELTSTTTGNNDTPGIEGLRYITSPDIVNLPFGQASILTINLLETYSSQEILAALKSGELGKIPMYYADDAIVSSATMELTGEVPPIYDSGVFTVGETGLITTDFLFDGSANEGELALFSLEGMEALNPESDQFIQEAARRALTNSTLGHIIISDPAEGAKFSGELPYEENYNSGEYTGTKTFLMNPGDRFGFMLVPDGWVAEVFENPNASGSKQPLFSMSTTALDDALDGKQFAWVVSTAADNNAFSFEDLSPQGNPDQDYNDIVFQVRGASSNTSILDAVINSEKDWRTSSVGAAVIAYLELAEDLGLGFIPLAVGNGVWFLGEGIPPEELRIIRPTSLNAADTINTDQIWAGIGLNLDGNGLTVGIWEAGGDSGNWRVRNTHEKLAGRTVLVDTDQPAAFSDHATRVAGVLGAAIGGVGRNAADARGMASQVNLRSYNSRNDTAEMDRDAGLMVASNHSYGASRGWNDRAVEPRNSPPVNTTPANRTNVWLGNRGGDYSISSGEDPGFGKYGSEAQALDRVLFKHPYLLSVWSAGNDRDNQFDNANGSNSYVTYFGSDPNLAGFNWSGKGWYLVPTSIASPPGRDGDPGTGYDSLPDEKAAKNTLVVGAINAILTDPGEPGYSAVNYTTQLNRSMSDFSSWGPTDDGRVKPDVVANGVGVLAASSGSDIAYNVGNGTSFAAPSVTGTAVLLIQHYQNLFNTLPRSATTKGLLIHTATDAGNIGPDYQFGWGVVNAASAANFLTNTADPNPTHFVREETYTGLERTMTVWSDGSSPLKATLAWTDPAGRTQGRGVDVRTPVLTHDLDLWITGPNGIYHPWTLDPLTPASPASQATKNHLDNVEQVLISNPVAGEYTIHVGHSERSFKQNYSLLVDGGTVQQGNLAVTIRRLKGDFDGGPSDSDFYTRVSFDNGNTWLRSPQRSGNDIRPNWALSQFVEGSTVPITIQVYDNDSFLRGENDHVDIDPNRENRDINLFYNLFTGEILGDPLEVKDQWLYSQGGGDSTRGEIWFSINFASA